VGVEKLVLAVFHAEYLLRKLLIVRPTSSPKFAEITVSVPFSTPTGVYTHLESIPHFLAPFTALNCDSRRTINLPDVAHVAQTFFARRLRLQPILDAVGKVVGFGQEVRRVARRVEFVKFPARTISAQPQSFVNEGRIDFEPAFRPVDSIEAFHVGTVGSVATGYDAGRELHCPGDILVHLIEAAILIDDRGIGRDVFRLLAGQVATQQLNGVHPDAFHEWLSQQRRVSLTEPFSPKRFLSTIRKSIGQPPNSARILVVAEEPIREIMAVILAFSGYRCRAVPGGAQALKLLDSGETFDLVTTDINYVP
jgi:hypothetical protein